MVKLITDHLPDQLKLPFMLWTRAAVRDLIAERFGVNLSLVTVGNYLRKRGMSARKPVRKAWQQNPGAVERWRKEEYPEIQRRAKEENALIFWADEGKVTNEVHHERSCAPKGRTPVVRESDKQLKLHHISAVTNKGEMRFRPHTSTMTQLKYLLFLGRSCRPPSGRPA